MSEFNVQTENRSTNITFSFDDLTSGSSLINDDILLRNPLPQRVVSGASVLLFSMLLLNSPSPAITPVWDNFEQGASSTLWMEDREIIDSGYQQVDEEIELDSPMWLSKIISEFQDRDFIRINDPRNQIS